VQRVPEVKWIRIMYAYPGAVSDRLIEVMARYPQVAHYLDIPLQHGHPAVLRRMRRPANIEWVYRTVEKLRRAMPDIALRTTFIVGYPGETEEEFEALLRFVRDLEFDRVGCFTYSYEPETPSARQPGHLPEEVKQERYERLMAAQQPISLRKNQALVGKDPGGADRRRGGRPERGANLSGRAGDRRAGAGGGRVARRAVPPRPHHWGHDLRPDRGRQPQPHLLPGRLFPAPEGHARRPSR
jgi:radical SAM superfamily enzyme YgiQ (UPF0313 family)